MFREPSTFREPNPESGIGLGEFKMPNHVSPDQLWILNLVLDRDPDLLRALTAGILALGRDASAVAKNMGGPPQTVQEEGSKTAELEPRILGWFQAHGGKHPISAARKDLGLELTSKPFKTAVANLVQSKALKHNGKRGKGSEYWL